jgi:hypothetical protein
MTFLVQCYGYSEAVDIIIDVLFPKEQQYATNTILVDLVPSKVLTSFQRERLQDVIVWSTIGQIAGFRENSFRGSQFKVPKVGYDKSTECSSSKNPQRTLCTWCRSTLRKFWRWLWTSCVDPKELNFWNVLREVLHCGFPNGTALPSSKYVMHRPISSKGLGQVYPLGTLSSPFAKSRSINLPLGPPSVTGSVIMMFYRGMRFQTASPRGAWGYCRYITVPS